MHHILILPIMCVALGLGVATWMSLAPGRSEPLLRRRLSRFTTDEGETAVAPPPALLDEEELNRSFFERAIKPILTRMEALVTPLSTSGQMASIERRLVAADGFLNLTPQGFVAFQVACATTGVVAGVGLTLVLGSSGFTLWITPMGGFLIGLFAPHLKLSAKVRERQLQILEALPNALDLLCISVEAGLGLDAALMRVAEKYRNALADEITQVLNEMKLGRPRRDALLSMAERCQVEELATFVQALVQSEQLGTSLATTLRIQSEEMRRKRRQRAEELGAKAPLKMLLPMVGCIFPTIFIVLLGPAGLEVYAQFVGGK